MPSDPVPYAHPWAEVPIRQHAGVTVGGTPSTAVSSFWYGGTVRWMSSGDVHQKRIHDVPGRITERGLLNSAARIVDPPTVAIGLAGQGKTRGTTALTLIPLSTNQSVALIKPDEKALSAAYLFHNLDFRYEELRSRSLGGGRAGLSKSVIELIPIPLPDFREQTAIAGILDTVDEAIRQTAAVIEKLKKIKAGLLHDLLTRGIDEDGQLRDNDPSRNPVPISSFAHVNPPVDSTRLLPQTPVSFVPMEDVSESGHWTNRQDREWQKVKAGYTAFQEGDILFAKITPCMENGKGFHACGTMNGVGFASTEFHVLRAKGKNSARFVFWQTMNPALRLRAAARMTGSAGQLRVPASFFDSFAMPCFDPDEQVRIAERLDGMEVRIQAESATLRKLTLMKHGLMQDLLTGRVRVPMKGNGKARKP